ncbi:hypothetical protein C942_00951 [Photobacterium marinum]|uniref:Uncharacterized protein n=1 Tax=Photobacterium marinum TaxID=1056511 RepID=L8JEB6_9GAMM|nr:hypothetical protein [Photobacterium marinum]ELR65864.1 hypothetical protein C942_00951 [Photobacterium marinum]
MDPITIISLASSLLKAGPTLIKTVGGLFGEKSSQTAVKVADAVEQVSTSLSSPEARQLKVEQLVKSLPPQELKQLEKIQIELAQIEAEREARQLEHEQALFESGQQTIREGDKSNNGFVALTRPLQALISTFAASYYVISNPMPDMVIAGFLIGLAMTYMGARYKEKQLGIAS